MQARRALILVCAVQAIGTFGCTSVKLQAVDAGSDPSLSDAATATDASAEPDGSVRPPCDPARVINHSVQWDQQHFNFYGNEVVPLWHWAVTRDGHYTRTDHSGTESCMRTLSACAPDKVDLEDLDDAIQHPDVQAALESEAQHGGYGFDGPSDSWLITIDGRHFSYGTTYRCGDGSPYLPCTDPPGVRALYEMLGEITAQEHCHVASECRRNAITGCADADETLVYFDVIAGACATSSTYCADSAAEFSSIEQCEATCTKETPVTPSEIMESPCTTSDAIPDPGLLVTDDNQPAPCAAVAALSAQGVEIVRTARWASMYALADSGLYWRTTTGPSGAMGIERFDKDGSNVWRYPIDGDFAVDECRMYVGDGVSLRSQPLSGTTPTTLASIDGAGVVFATDERYLYYSTFNENTPWPSAGYSVMRIARGGGTTTTLAQVGPTWDGGPLALHGDHVYLLGGCGYDSTVPCSLLRVPSDGSTGPEIVLENLPVPMDLAISATHIYFTINGAILRVAFDGTPPETILSDVNPGSLTVTDEHLYFVDLLHINDAYVWALKRSALDGGPTEALLQSPPMIDQLQHDGTHLYWRTDYCGDVTHLLRMPLP